MFCPVVGWLNAPLPGWVIIVVCPKILSGFLKAAKDAANALIKGQNELAGWDHKIYFDRPKGDVVSFDDNQTQGAISFLMALDQETEIEWQPLQIGMVDEVSKSVDSPKPSVVYKFQFFSYLGRYDDDGYVDPISGNKPGQPEDQRPFVDAAGVAYVTIDGTRHDLDFIGQQIAGFNAVEVAAVPEPAEWLLMSIGLGGIAARVRRRRSA